jgi:hypothetical protein
MLVAVARGRKCGVDDGFARVLAVGGGGGCGGGLVGWVWWVGGRGGVVVCACERVCDGGRVRVWVGWDFGGVAV